MSRRRPPLPLSALLLSIAFASNPARAEEANPISKIAGTVDGLAHGGTLVHRDAIESLEGRCVGGVVYAILDGAPTKIRSTLTRPEDFRRLLPLTRSAEWTPLRERTGHSIRIHQGNALFDVAYTLNVVEERAGLRFSLDRSEPHDLRDAWGFIRLEPLDDHRTLVTFGLMVQLGSDLLANLFEKRIQRTLVTLPTRLRTLLAIDPSKM